MEMKTLKRKTPIQQVRQGDVLVTVTSAETDASDNNEPLTVAYGEQTGHHHTFERGCQLVCDESAAISTETAAQMIARLGGGTIRTGRDGAEMRHQEHAPVKIKGTARVTIQREYQRGAIRNVAD